MKKIFLILVFFVCLFSLSGCSYYISETNINNSSNRVLEAAISNFNNKEIAKKNILIEWDKESTDENSISTLYHYFLFSNGTLFRIPDNDLYIDIYIDAEVNNPEPNVYTLASYSANYKEYYKEEISNKFFRSLIKEKDEIVFKEVREEEILKKYNLNWLVEKEEYVRSLDETKLKKLYINTRLFESYYRELLANSLVLDTLFSIPYEEIINYKDKYETGSLDYSMHSFLFNAYSGQGSFYSWIDNYEGNNSDIKKLVDELSIKVDNEVPKEEMIKYILNLKISEDNFPYFLNQKMFFEISYLDKDLNLNKTSIKNMQQMNAYNTMRIEN